MNKQHKVDRLNQRSNILQALSYSAHRVHCTEPHTDSCTEPHVDPCTELRVDLCTELRVDLCTELRVDLCTELDVFLLITHQVGMRKTFMTRE